MGWFLEIRDVTLMGMTWIECGISLINQKRYKFIIFWKQLVSLKGKLKCFWICMDILRKRMCLPMDVMTIDSLLRLGSFLICCQRLTRLIFCSKNVVLREHKLSKREMQNKVQLEWLSGVNLKLITFLQLKIRTVQHKGQSIITMNRPIRL